MHTDTRGWCSVTLPDIGSRPVRAVRQKLYPERNVDSPGCPHVVRLAYVLEMATKTSRINGPVPITSVKPRASGDEDESNPKIIVDRQGDEHEQTVGPESPSLELIDSFWGLTACG